MKAMGFWVITTWIQSNYETNLNAIKRAEWSFTEKSKHLMKLQWSEWNFLLTVQSGIPAQKSTHTHTKRAHIKNKSICIFSSFITHIYRWNSISMMDKIHLIRRHYQRGANSIFQSFPHKTFDLLKRILLLK